MQNFITLRGCKLHNLKNVDAEFPLKKITVVCGPSGCGKSSLALDTLHGESKRRYLATLSPFAAELLGGSATIPIDSAENLPASISIGVCHGETQTKSYALSIAECDYALRKLFATFAKPACKICGEPMKSESREYIIAKIAAFPIGTKLQFLAKIETQDASLEKISAAFLAQGFTRAIADNKVISLADISINEANIKPKEFFIVTDRIIIRENTRTRIAEAIDSTLKLTHGLITLEQEGKQIIFSTVPRCLKHGIGETFTLSAESFSPYSKTNACEYCNGIGKIEDEECKFCNGLRLNKNSLNASIESISWKTLLLTPFNKLEHTLHNIFDNVINEKQKHMLNSITDRIQAIVELGIGYIGMGRAGYTLSSGEIQRLRLSSLSTGLLNGLLIVLDEPASGLHISDVQKLWRILEKVKARDNTLVLIEHNPEIIKNADWIIEMGEGAGENGGKILAQGLANTILQSKTSPTANWIRSLDAIKKNICAKKITENFIEVSNFHLFDMQNVNAKFPVQKFSVITGQSGSGKSTLMFKNLSVRAKNGEFEKLGIRDLSILSTGDFHGNRRSTVASAIDIFSMLRELFAKMPESKVRGYTAAKFSTHAPGGRCENCKGEGVIFDNIGYEESKCPVCNGARYKDEILEIRFKSLSIADILDMEISNALKLFLNLKPFAQKLKPLTDTGLGYLKLGQTTAHMSGGERARLRLSIALSRAKAPNTLFLFDEPARGLHLKDMEHLLKLIQELTKAGHTVIAIEHAQNFVNAADYVLELKRS